MGGRMDEECVDGWMMGRRWMCGWVEWWVMDG